MDTNNTRRLHPLLTLAAVSLTVFSAVGVAALSGLIPQSKGSASEETPVAAAPAQTEAAKPEALPAPQTAPKPARKHVAHAAARDLMQPAQVAQTPQMVEAPKPVVKPGVLGTVQAVLEVEEKGDAKGVGAVGGGLAGAVLGHNIGEHNKLVTLLGAAGGALLGNQIEKQARATKHWEMTVRYDDGTMQTFKSEAQPFWHQGDRVRLYEGKLQPV